MRIRWRGLELPNQVILDKSVSTESYGRFEIEPFERGFGTTVGNSLRRILLSSLEGASVTSCKIDGVSHEFMGLEGVPEDVPEIILNVKGLLVKSEVDEPRTLTIEVQGPGAGKDPIKVTGADIKADASVEVVNKNQHLCTLTGPVKFHMELTVKKGRGFVPASEQYDEEEQVIGVIPLDANYSPVARVRYHTEDTRVGQKTNYDKLIMEIWTKGTITPEMALVESAKILRKHLNPFVQYFELGEQVAAQEAGAAPGLDEALNAKLNLTVHDLELSVRALNCLESAKILKVRDLVQRNEDELLKVRSFGKTSLREVKRKLTDLGLSLGMAVPSEPAPAPAAEKN